MSTLERDPVELGLECRVVPGPVARLVPERIVPLGGPRGMVVTRTVPDRSLPAVGPWCFFDQGGPERHRSALLPHPHIGLQTFSWLLTGELLHRDTAGSSVRVRPGQLNLMTAGRGIAHSEFTPDDVDDLVHLMQLWIALPDGARWQAPHFEQHEDLPVVAGDGWTGTVLIGSFAGQTSPAAVYHPIVGVELRIEPSATATIELEWSFEHAILAGTGTVRTEGVDLGHGPLLYLGTDRRSLELTAGPEGAVVMLIGGAPLGEQLIMWWNFVGRTHEEILQAREDWEDPERRIERYGPEIELHAGARIPAPVLPNVRLTPRIRPPEPR